MKPNIKNSNREEWNWKNKILNQSNIKEWNKKKQLNSFSK